MRLYRALRFVHVVVTAAVLPLGLWHLVEEAERSAAVGMPGVLRLVLFVVAAMLALFVLALDQAGYPTTLRGALVRTVPVLASFTALALASGAHGTTALARTLAAAHWTLTSLLAALAVALVSIGVLTFRDPSMQKQRKLIYAVVLPLLAGVLCACALAGWPLVRAFDVATSSALPQIASAVVWLVQTALTSHAWMGHSVFAKATAATESGAGARSRSMEAWGGVIALAFAADLLAFTIVLMAT